jgi:hypothetical protein
MVNTIRSGKPAAAIRYAQDADRAIAQLGYN